MATGCHGLVMAALPVLALCRLTQQSEFHFQPLCSCRNNACSVLHHSATVTPCKDKFEKNPAQSLRGEAGVTVAAW